MRATISRLAESISKRPLNLKEAGAALLPPIQCVHARARIFFELTSTIYADYIGESFVSIDISL